MVDTAGATIIELPTGQAEVIEVQKDPEPRLFDVTRAAIAEGEAWLDNFGGGEELDEEGTLRAEVLRNLITAADFYGGVAISALSEMQALGAKAGGALQDIA